MSDAEQPPSDASGARPQRIRKAAPKSGRRGRRGPVEPVAVTPELLAGAPLFGLLDLELRTRLAPRVTHVQIERGEHLFTGRPLEDDASPVFIVLFGDVSVHRTRQRDERIANYLSVGEGYVQKLFAHEETEALRLTAMCPVRALRLEYRDANYLLRKSEAFRDAFSAMIKSVTERQGSRFDDAFQSEIARFFVQERLTFAGRVKIKRMDICIECDGCYDACKTRHGTDRLGTSEVKFGLTEIPQNCHNCVVPECIDKCKFGQISKHAVTGEIIIHDDCTGCTMCSRGCSFGAIKMHPLQDLDVAKFFPNRSPDAKGKNIAQKCDNCTAFADRACITACPTGALFQVDGPDLFNHWKQFQVHQAPGFDAVSTPEATPRGWRRFWVALALVNLAILGWESLGRLFWQDLTAAAFLFRAGITETGLDPDAPFKAGDPFSHAMGYIGGGCMLATQLYRLGKRLAPRLGSTRAWMESHIGFGVIGGIYGFFHTAFHFFEPVAVATFLLMLLAIVTGAVGRYLLFLVPRSKAGRQLMIGELDVEVRGLDREIEGAMVDRRAAGTMMTRVQDLARGEAGRAAAREGTGRRLVADLMALMSDDRAQRKAIDGLANELGEAVPTEHRAQVVGLLQRKARLERSVRRHAFLGRVLKRYRVVHVVASNVMFGALALHIVLSLMYQVGG